MSIVQQHKKKIIVAGAILCIIIIAVYKRRKNNKLIEVKTLRGVVKDSAKIYQLVDGVPKEMGITQAEGMHLTISGEDGDFYIIDSCEGLLVKKSDVEIVSYEK